MDALQTVFDTILKVFAIIKDFFEKLLPSKEDDETAEGEVTE